MEGELLPFFGVRLRRPLTIHISSETPVK